MALAKSGGGVTDLRGSISGNTFSRNRGGMIVRARTVPTNTRSSSQSKSRSLFAYLTSAWNNQLTTPQRTAWDTYAHAVASKNKLGETIHLTGQLQFIRTNQVRMTAGLTLETDGPTILSLPETDPTLSIWSVTPPLLSISFDESQSWRTEDGGALSIMVSQPQPATKNYFTGPWRFAGTIVGSSTNPPLSPCFVPFPFSITTGQNLFVKACVLRADGRTTNPFDLPPMNVTGVIPTTATINYGTIRQIGVWVFAIYFNQPMSNAVICSPTYWRLRKSNGTPVTIQNFLWVNPSYGDFKVSPNVDPGVNCRMDYMGKDPGIHAVADNSDCLPINNVLVQHT